MLATRPAPTTTEAETASSAQEEKTIHGIERDALRDERKPLLDLDDVAQFESELAACFDAPPSQPLSIRRDRPAPSVAPWPPAASAATSQRVENRYVHRSRLDPSATVAPPAVSAGTTAGIQAFGHLSTEDVLQQEKQALLQMDMDEVEAEVEAGTAGKAIEETSLMGPSDFSSLYTPQRTVSSRQLYPSLPVAPSTQALMAESERQEASQSTVEPTAPPREVVRPGPSAAQHRAAATRSSVVEAAASAVASRREAGMGTQAAGGSSDISVEVVEELLTENEKLRLIIQDMSEELDRVSQQNDDSLATALAREQESATSAPASSSTGANAESGTASSSRSSIPVTFSRFPGAQAEEARRRREQMGGRTGRHEYVHFKCENCPQWLKVPGNAQLIFCPTCSHTSQMTSSSIIHRPAGNGDADRRGAQAGSSDTADQENPGFVDFFRRIFV